ncbi:hypothetical protein FDF69_20225 [Clostridium sporogenes]|uniref:hypothetical protein n=1 Tax=Clostridium sporogenes TaxID=1509 RepID=UPI0013D1F9CD|nr:hypothetical protein [Clostridium sporogenes]NFF69418.1 hypothetical protein [Clostridium sporogenes]NFG00693.1 hypothetical protein [Clostridium sporogenes]NFG08261.1 hypothetical protein [Clostridium sporogenes]NFG53391.1 hypothetical protein [Clostridium sporogenes]NFP86219.1 hypothetical protein [Clostridium sporogenes]
MFKSSNVKTVTPAKFPRPKPPGTEYLLTKDKVKEIYIKECIAYINKEIKEACNNGETRVSLDANRLNAFGLIEQLMEEYDIVYNDNRIITIKII